MNAICTNTSLSIARFAFQFILHQALLSQPQQTHCGLLGLAAGNDGVIQHAPLCASAQNASDTVQQWQQDGIICIGLYFFSPAIDTAHLQTVMPDTYLQLHACLDEKGRLDLFANRCQQGNNKLVPVPLTLVEDGQLAANV